MRIKRILFPKGDPKGSPRELKGESKGKEAEDDQELISPIC